MVKPKTYRPPNHDTCRKCEYSVSVEFEGGEDYESALICTLGENEVNTEVEDMDDWQDLVGTREVDSLGSCPSFKVSTSDD